MGHHAADTRGHSLFPDLFPLFFPPFFLLPAVAYDFYNRVTFPRCLPLHLSAVNTWPTITRIESYFSFFPLPSLEKRTRKLDKVSFGRVLFVSLMKRVTPWNEFDGIFCSHANDIFFFLFFFFKA